MIKSNAENRICEMRRLQAYHSSRDADCRYPVGARACSEEVTLRIKTDSDGAVLRLWTCGKEFRREMTKCDGGFEITVEMPETPCVVWYFFILGTCFYGNRGDDLGGEGELYMSEPPSFQITVYDPAFSAPDWLGDGIMMQIMPDRFFRGGKAPIRGRAHADWYEPPFSDISESGDNRADDYFGGDLDGIAQKMDYIKSLGVSVIYLNPIFEASSNHGYNTADYSRVEAGLGDDAALERLLARAKEAGVRVILDGVFSHTGSDSVYFNREGNYGGGGAYNSKASEYYDWYDFKRWPDDYKCWWGFPTLPEINKKSRSYREFIINGDSSVCAKYLRAGAAGWRLDVADELPMDFLREFRKRAKRENPDCAIIGEVWEDSSRKVAYGILRSYCLGDTLDSVMNYPVREAILGFLTGEISAVRAARIMASIYENLPPMYARSLMNLLGSHDKARALSVLAGAGNMEPDRRYRYPVNHTPEEYARGKSRLIAAWKIICALPGMPTIYYGDEAGMTGMSDPFCRAAYPWGREDTELTEAFRETAKLRLGSETLLRGKAEFAAEGDDTLIVTRTLDGKTARLTVRRDMGEVWDFE